MLAGYAYVWITVYSGCSCARRQRLHADAHHGRLRRRAARHGAAETLTGWLLVSATVWASGSRSRGWPSGCAARPRPTTLTGLLNRRAFITAAEREHELARPHRRRPGGRAHRPRRLQGDQRPRRARRRRPRCSPRSRTRGSAALRPADILARHGADEFALLLPATSEDGAGDVVAAAARRASR